MPTPIRSKIVALERLRGMAFRHFDRCHEAVEVFHSLGKRIGRHPLADEIWNVHDWLLSPFSLWPIDFVGLARHIARELRRKRDFDVDLVLLLQLLDSPPTEFTQAAIAAYEQKVQAGEYDSLVKQPQKFQEHEATLQRDGELLGYWRRVKERFPTAKYEANARHVIRRSMSQERNFRPLMQFTWHRRKDKFEQIFDALCYRWYLYGFEGDRPLLLKISVNPTPHGTMIVIPRHWSFDKARDLDWGAISKLHRAHGATRQGPKLSSSRIERLSEAAQSAHYAAEARRLKLRGDARYEFICAKMKRDPKMDPSWLKRLLKSQ
jgi:hypothetical protein